MKSMGKSFKKEITGTITIDDYIQQHNYILSRFFLTISYLLYNFIKDTKFQFDNILYFVFRDSYKSFPLMLYDKKILNTNLTDKEVVLGDDIRLPAASYTEKEMAFFMIDNFIYSLNECKKTLKYDACLNISNGESLEKFIEKYNNIKEVTNRLRSEVYDSFTLDGG